MWRLFFTKNKAQSPMFIAKVLMKSNIDYIVFFYTFVTTFALHLNKKVNI